MPSTHDKTHTGSHTIRHSGSHTVGHPQRGQTRDAPDRRTHLDAVHTRPVVQAGARQAVVDVGLAVVSPEACVGAVALIAAHTKDRPMSVAGPCTGSPRSSIKTSKGLQMNAFQY